MKFRSGLRRADLELETTFKKASAGLRNSFEVMRDVKIKDRSTNFVGNLDIADPFKGGLDGVVTAWNSCLLDRYRRKCDCLTGKTKGFRGT